MTTETTETHTEEEEYQIASFDKRLLAFVIDTVIYGGCYLVLAVVISSSGKTALLLGQILWLVLFVIYRIYLVKRFGATPGKLIMKIRIVNVYGEAPGWREAFLRSAVPGLINLINLLVFVSIFDQLDYEYYLTMDFIKGTSYLQSLSPAMKYVSLVMLTWTLADIITYFVSAQVKALHDQIAGTLVVRS